MQCILNNRFYEETNLIIGVVGLTAGSWGQLSDTFELTGVTYTNRPNVYDYSGPGWEMDVIVEMVNYMRQNANGTWSHIWFDSGMPYRAFTTTGPNPYWSPKLHEIDTSTWPTNIVVNAGYLTNAAYLSQWSSQPAWATQHMAPTPTPAPTGSGDVLLLNKPDNLTSAWNSTMVSGPRSITFP